VTLAEMQATTTEEKMTAILFVHGQFLHIFASSITSNPIMEIKSTFKGSTDA
jgi:hypothetical protein